MSSTSGVSNELVAWFAGESDAEATVKELLDAGIPRDAVRLMPGSELDGVAEGGDGRSGIEPFPAPGFVASLGVALPARALEDEPPQSGANGCVVAVETNGTNHDQAAEILTRRGRLDRDEADER